MAEEYPKPWRITFWIVAEFMVVITDLPEVFDELNAQLADPNSLLLTGNTTGFVASGNTTQVVFNALQGLHSLAYACPGRLVRDPTTNTCEPCPATTEYRRDVDGTQSCEVCPVGRWSEEAGQCQVSVAGS